LGTYVGRLLIRAVDSWLYPRHIGIYTSVMQYGYYIVGDLDGDGRVTSADATALARWLAGHDVAHLIANSVW